MHIGAPPNNPDMKQKMKGYEEKVQQEYFP